jgi:hypothetical protein
MPPRVLALCCLLASCAPEPVAPELHFTVLPSVGEVLHPTPLYVRFDEPGKQLTLNAALDGPELARGSAVAGMKYAVTLEGRTCELESNGPRTETENVEKNTNEVTPVRDPGYRTRTTTVLGVTLRCADGQPPPGVVSASSVRGWAVMGWMSAAVVLGLLLGAMFFRGDDSDSGALEFGSVALGIAALIAVLVFTWHHHTGGLVLSLPLLAAVCGGTGFLAALLALRNPDGRSRAGAVGMLLAGLAGPTLVSFTTPLWGGGAPLVAALVTLVTFAVAGAVAASGK